MGKPKIRVGITLGDFNGIGYEVVIKTLSDPRMLEMLTPVLYGSGKALAHYKKSLEAGARFHYTVVKATKEAKDGAISLVECGDENVNVEEGKSTREAGKVAVESLRVAVRDAKEELLDVLVTAPINKENVQADGFDFKGHTEFLASEFGGEPLMMMCSELLKVGLTTIHIPLSEVAGSVTKEGIVNALRKLRKSLIVDFGVVEPKIAVLSLNPHAGDGGLLGKEEESVIRPAIEGAIKGGVLAFGPFAADGFFAAGSYAKYDAVLAMYHDQGLTPFKALTPEGVNFTAGLSFVRTSPDHGVAYDIAGKGVADDASLRGAIYMALDIYRNRGVYGEMSKNPLRHHERERGGKDLSVRDMIPEKEHND